MDEEERQGSGGGMVVQYLPNDIRFYSSFILIYKTMVLDYINHIYSQAIALKCLSTH